MYNYEKFNVRLFPTFLLLLGIVFSLTKMYVEGSVAGTFGVLFSVSFKGLTIDPKKMLYRQYDRFLWFYLGKWKEIPPPLYVTVVRIKVNVSRNSPLPMPSAGDSNASRTYKINLVVDSRKRFISLTHGSRANMLTEGLKIARTLKIGMLDHTTSEKKWIE